MNPRIPKLAEILIHIVAVVVITTLAIRNYELINYMVLEGVPISSESEAYILRGYSSSPDTAAGSVFQDTMNSEVTSSFGSSNDAQSSQTNQMIWHGIVYGLYLTGWFVSYFMFFKRNQSALKKKLLALTTGWLGFAIIHMVIVVFAGVMLNTEPTTSQTTASALTTQPSTTVFRFGTFSSFSDSLFAVYFLIVLVAFLAQTTTQFLYRYQELEEADHMQSELALIRAQLRPHFFFNTLNNLYSMALESKNEALADGLQNLTGLMRYSLTHSTKKLVPLREEWEYIKRYVELQKLRLNPESVDINMEISGDLHSAQIAPMILINFVENAFKHGISYERPSFVEMKLNITETYIILTVCNSNHPSKQEAGVSGIGTAQTKKLLALYYEDDFDLDILSNQQQHEVILKLPRR
ncbi:sensor histidine kinase [Gracilimonas mengyeensis]|uniref:Histidine kinase n=1 Tax=Gracilimonas mengyeensis TaxID=1302730 RepID=A0A521CFG2_9BACT|nr:sensor histidine kinase [Gracilimonas mengyeensis]SMO58177.1 Histidine kinase [Gracilimonas mengyeensis]